MVCPCHVEERRAGKYVKCMYNSRRLGEAPEVVDAQISTFLAKARDLTLEECFGFVSLHGWMVNALRAAAGKLDTRFKYLKTVPWSFSKADTQLGASTCLQQIDSQPEDAHDFLTVEFNRAFRTDLEVVRDGGPVSSRLEAEVRAINIAALDESAGEGYHRGTNCERIRAPGARTLYIKQSTRFRENVVQVRGVLKKFGKRGRQVVRYEWRNLKRVLQVQPGKLWRPKRMNDREFYERVYRMDEVSLADWSPLVDSTGLVDVPQEEAGDTSQKMALEYLSALVKPSTYYSLDQPRQLQLEDGSLVNRPATEYFQVVQVHTTRSRPKVIPTVATRTDKSMTSKLAFYIQPLSRWQPGGVETESLDVMADGEPYWVTPNDIAPFGTLRSSLVQWNEVAPSSVPQCQALHDGVAAQPQCALTDSTCSRN